MLRDEPAEIDLLLDINCISESQTLRASDCINTYAIQWHRFAPSSALIAWAASADQTPKSSC